MLVGLVISIAVVLVGNFLFFGTILPVQFIGVQPPDFGPARLLALAWHDIIGWNGILWLSPLVIPGIIGLTKRGEKNAVDVPLILLIGVTAIILVSWGISEDSRVIAENESFHPAFAVVPLELNEGQFSMVDMGSAEGSDSERRAYYEMMFQRTDIFLFNGGRPVGIPVFLQGAVLLSLIGWCRFVASRVSGSIVWVLVRLGGLIGLVTSQAPYGGVSGYYLYTGMIVNQSGDPVYSKVPFLEALLTVTTRLAELWPSGVVRF